MAGKMDKRITITREVQTDDGHNGVVASYETICIIWAHVFIGSGTENYKFRRVFTKDSYVFVVRNNVDIASDDVIDYEGDRMNITHVMRIDGRDQYMTIEAVKGAGV